MTNLPECGVEKAVFEQLNDLTEVLRYVDYVAVDWSLIQSTQVHLKSSNRYCISVCSGKETLLKPEVVKSYGVSHLFCTFAFSAIECLQFEKSGIKLMLFPWIENEIVNQNCNENYILDVRAMGKKGHTVAMSLYSAKHILQIEPFIGRTRFSDSTPTHYVEVETKSLAKDRRVAELFSTALFGIFRVKDSAIYDCFILALQTSCIPLFPKSCVDNVSQYDGVFKELLTKLPNKIVFEDTDSNFHYTNVLEKITPSFKQCQSLSSEALLGGACILQLLFELSNHEISLLEGLALDV